MIPAPAGPPQGRPLAARGDIVYRMGPPPGHFHAPCARLAHTGSVMTLLELAVSGIRNFTGFTRVPLKPGLNTVWGGNQSGKTTLWQVLRQLLVRDRRLAATDDGPTWGRAALTFVGDDGNTYCLARQFSEPSERLARHRPGAGFIAEEPAPGPGRGPVDPQDEGEPSLWSACLGGAAWLPSARLRPGPQRGAVAGESLFALADDGPAGAPGGTGLDLVPTGVAVERAAAERRLEALGHVEIAARQAAEMEFELAAAYDRAALLRARLDGVKEIVHERAATEKELEALEAAVALPPELEEKARAFDHDHRAVREQQRAIEADTAELIDDLDHLPAVRPLREWSFYAGTLLTGLGALSHAAVGWQPITYAVLAGATVVVGLLVYRVTAASQQRRALRQHIEVQTANARNMEVGLLATHQALLAQVRAAGIATVDAFLQQRERHAILAARYQRLGRREGDLMDDDALDAARAELEQVATRIEELEAALARLQVSGADLDGAQREQEALVQVLGREDAGGETEPEVDLSIEPHLDADPPLREALDRRKDQYCARAGEYLARFTGGEFTGLSVNGSYRPTLHTERDGVANLGRPGAGMVDLIYLAQYLAMVEVLDPSGRFPMLLDEPFLSLDPERRTLLYDTLRETARRRQVVVFTCQQFLTSPGDHLVRLKG
jgi:hypothetical protein